MASGNHALRRPELAIHLPAARGAAVLAAWARRQAVAARRPAGTRPGGCGGERNCRTMAPPKSRARRKPARRKPAGPKKPRAEQPLAALALAGIPIRTF